MTHGIRRTVAPTLILAAVGVALYFAATTGSSWAFRDSWFASHNPGANPPWFFIGQDLVGGIWGASAFLLSCLCALLSASRLRGGVWWIWATQVVWFAPMIAAGLNARLHTTDPFSRAQASTTWRTFDVYFQSRQATSEGAARCSAAAVLVVSGSVRRGDPQTRDIVGKAEAAEQGNEADER